MIILAIETTGPLASVAVLYNNHRIKETVNHTHYSHLEEIVPMIQNMMREEDLKAEDITAIAVSRGPGSFTGIRIGVATAKALAQVWNKSIIDVPTLKSFAYGEDVPEGQIVCPIFDARRDQVYAAAYKKEGRLIQTLIKEGAYSLDAFLSVLGECNQQAGAEIMFYGDAIKAYEGTLAAWEGNFKIAAEDQRFQRASQIALLGATLFDQGLVTDAFRVKPTYLRQSEAERKLLGKC